MEVEKFVKKLKSLPIELWQEDLDGDEFVCDLNKGKITKLRVRICASGSCCINGVFVDDYLLSLDKIRNLYKHIQGELKKYKSEQKVKRTLSLINDVINWK